MTWRRCRSHGAELQSQEGGGGKKRNQEVEAIAGKQPML